MYIVSVFIVSLYLGESKRTYHFEKLLAHFERMPPIYINLPSIPSSFHQIENLIDVGKRSLRYHCERKIGPVEDFIGNERIHEMNDEEQINKRISWHFN